MLKDRIKASGNKRRAPTQKKLKENLSDNVLEANETAEEKVQSAPIRIPTTQTVSFEDDSTPATKLIPEKPKIEVRKEEEKIVPKPEVESIKKDPVVSLFDVPDGNLPFFILVFLSTLN